MEKPTNWAFVGFDPAGLFTVHVSGHLLGAVESHFFFADASVDKGLFHEVHLFSLLSISYKGSIFNKIL